jgi:hypothetical protein
MRTHVRDCGGLPCRSRGSDRCRTAHLTRGGPGGEAAADLFRDVKLATAEGPGSRNRVAGAAIAWSLRLE